MNRVVTALIALALAAGAGVLAGCSGDKGGSAPETAPASPADSGADVSAGGAEVSTGGAAEVTVDGSAMANLDPASVSCVKQGGKISIGSGAAGPQQAVAVVMSDEATPRVESVALLVDGNALGVSDMMGVKTGSAEVKVDGDTYTVSGEAQGADVKNPMAGMITKPFTIKVTCS
ncbi:lipoprotein LpqH [Mycolicibacterium sp. HK-90]|uniref:lipoprotein LpqH n=1 Tax=Mycolicibacterium sp. HK-90 TaxID=3056937 RepID=UPI002657D3C0|nr:lipoprotein LpqH [Mycolicibacterium sp. HK-90]WKG02622.1 lipoprotein LpqH [Mycolicibacterium sp. HK-90]